MAIKLTIQPVVDRMNRAQRALWAQSKESVKQLSQRWVSIAQEEAPKKTGDFAQSIRAQIYETKNPIALGFRTYMRQPLGNWIIYGTKPHIIRPRNKNALHFFWPKIGKYVVVPKGGGFKTHEQGGKLWVGKGYVNHPGTKPNDFVYRAIARWDKEVEKQINKISDRWVFEMSKK